MRISLIEPDEEDSVDCHLQQIGMGSLICRAAKQSGRSDSSTNEVTPAVCFSCDVGKIYREVGCDAPLPRIQAHRRLGSNNPIVEIDGIFCKIRRRETTLDYCRTCTLATAESTRQIVTSTRGLLQGHGFHSAYQDLEKARLAIRDGEFASSITHSIACLESTCRIIHERLDAELPTKKQLTDLWKSLRRVLELDNSVEDDSLAPLLNSLHGSVTHVSAMRNALSDAHGRGQFSPRISEAMAELALNSAATVATFAVRHYQMKVAETTS